MSEYYTKRVFIGIDAPAAPGNIRISENGDSGEITLSWEPVTTDRNGQIINPDLISYDIAQYDTEQEGWVPFTDRMTATSHTFRAVAEGQQFVQYAVFAHTSGGHTPGMTEVTAVGTPYDEILESFPGKTPDHIWASGYSELDGSWIILDDNFGLPSQDGDYGYAAMKGFNNNSSAGLISGKVSLKNTPNPGIRLYVYNLLDENSKEADDINEVQIFVKEAGSDDWTALTQPIAMNSLGDDEGWKMISASLADYKGKTVQIRIQATTRVYFYTYIDNLKIGNLLNQDLSATNISAPKNVNSGEKFTISTGLSNVGLLKATGFSVELYENDKLVDSKDIDLLESGKDLKVDFERAMSPVTVEPLSMYVKIRYDEDEDFKNNETTRIAVAPKHSRLPAVTDLSAKDSENGIELSWSAPDLEATTHPNGNEDFENTESWAHRIDHWTFIDRDQSPVGGFRENSIPEIIPNQTTASFFVFDTADGEFNNTFSARSGNKYLAALFRYDDGQTDDWAISPVLDGSAQTVSFWARSYSQQFREKIEMLYSNGSLDPDDFILVKTIESVPGDIVENDGNPQPKWIEYTFDVPAGAKYFAIRSCATGSFMLQLDDFTFKPGVSDLDLVIKGYDIYRDGELITDSPVGTTTYLDKEVTVGDHDYVNVTVYETGISAPSNVVSVTRSDVENIVSDNIRITTGKNMIVIAGAEGLNITVSDTSGRTIYADKADSTVNIPADTGVYAVTAGSTSVKVIVR